MFAGDFDDAREEIFIWLYDRTKRKVFSIYGRRKIPRPM
jgi:hypothetical protein